MKFGFIIAFILGLFLVSGNVFAFEVPSPTGHVTDTSGKLSGSDVAALDSKLRNIEKTTQNEIAVLVVSSLDGDSIEDAAHEVFKSWKIGKAGLDNGVLLMIAVKDRKTRIQTGKGVEGDLTDIQTQDILVSLKPYLRNGNFAGACNVAVDKINATLETRKGQKADPGKGAQFNKPLPADPDIASSHPSSSSGCSFAMYEIGASFGLGIFFLLALMTYIIRSRRRMNDRIFAYQKDVSNAKMIPAPLFIPPVQLEAPAPSYVVQGPKVTLRNSVLPEPPDSEPTQPSIQRSTIASIFPRGHSYTYLDLDSDSDVTPDSENSSFGGGDTNGGGSSMSWDDASSNDNDVESSNDSDDSDGSSGEW